MMNVQYKPFQSINGLFIIHNIIPCEVQLTTHMFSDFFLIAILSIV